MAKVDPILYRMCLEFVKPGACVWDIGANVGLFSFCSAALAGADGYVLAIEPDVWLAHLIHRTAQLWLQNDYSAAPVAVLCSAASDASDINWLHIAERERAANYVRSAAGSSQSGGYRSTQLTASVTLDFLLKHFRPPSFLKIDVETHELQVLTGASGLLRTCRPLVWCEVSPQNYKAAFQLFSSAGYDLFNAESKEKLSGSANWNTLAIPR
jgi:FkbM family methyltransferase